MALLFQALGDATRLRILGLLSTGEVCVCDIHDAYRTAFGATCCVENSAASEPYPDWNGEP